MQKGENATMQEPISGGAPESSLHSPMHASPPCLSVQGADACLCVQGADACLCVQGADACLPVQGADACPPVQGADAEGGQGVHGNHEGGCSAGAPQGGAGPHPGLPHQPHPASHPPAVLCC